MIRRNLSTIALVCALALAGCSEGETAPDILQTGQQANPLLLEITNPDGEVEGWMLGTIHALPDDTDWRTPAVDRVIDDADRLLVEVVGLDNSELIGQIFVGLATTPDLGPLPARVTPELREPIGEMIELSQIEPAQFENTENWAAAIMLSSVGAVGKPRNGVDRFLLTKFRSNETQAFETVTAQLSIFDNLAPSDQRDLLEGTVREWMASRDNPGDLTRAWLAGDEDALVAATSTGIMADAELRAALLVDRNRRWMPILLDNMEQTDALLVAVGTAHIVGPDGLPAMLEARGYTVRRLN